MRVIIECNSVDELLKTKNALELWWYNWKIMALWTESLVKDCKALTNDDRFGNWHIKEILWIQVIPISF